MLPKAEMVPKECGFNQTETACTERTIFTFPTGVVCRARWPGSSENLVIHAKVERWLHCWIHYLTCSRFPFCLSTGLDTNGWPIARGNWFSCRASEIYLAVALSGNRHTLPHHLVNAGKSDKLTHIHYNDKLDESPDLFMTSFASCGDTCVFISFT